MPAFTFRSLFLLTLAAGTLSQAAEPVFTVKPDHPDGVYAIDEKVTWEVDVKGDRATVREGVTLSSVPYTVKKDGSGEVASGTLDLSSGPVKISATRAEAGALVVTIPDPDKTKPQPLGVGAAMVAPEKIGPSLPEPVDFDAFWQAKLKDLAAIPINPVVEKVDISATVKNSEGVDYYKVSLDNINGTHVRGQLTRPTVGEKFPAILMLQYAGVYALNKDQVVAAAKPGWLALNISAHDLPIDEPDDYYNKLKDGELKNYVYIGNESRETSYFLRMLLGCVRAQEYLASRPDWDGRTLVVTGTSQGGLQSFATAGLCPKVTAMMVLVPAGCDNYAPLATPPRAFGWPYWISNWGPKDRDMKKVQETAGYFDAVYFAARIKCPSLVAAGLLDTTARPTGIIAAYNAIQAPKELLLMVNSDHHGAGGAQAEYSKCSNDWKALIKAGKPLPMMGKPETPFSSPGK